MSFRVKKNSPIRLIKVNVTTMAVELSSCMGFSVKTTHGEKKLLS